MYLGGNGRQRLIRITVVVAIAALVLSIASSLLTALSASAHTVLSSISPADGSTAQTAPQEVRLEFTEDVSETFAAITVTGVDGAEAGEGKAVVDGAVVTQPLKDGLGSGAYAVAYRVVAADGHPISGSASFTLDVAPVAQGGGATASTEPTAPDSSTTTSPETSDTAVGEQQPSGTTPAGTATLVDGGDSQAVPDGSMPVLVAGGVLVLAAMALALMMARRRGSAAHSDPDA